MKRRLAASRLNFELVGIALLGLAALLAVTLVAPHHAGALGTWVGWALSVLFGRAAGGFPGLIAVLAGIVFLEISVPQMIRTLWAAACAFFLLALAALGPQGGSAGAALSGVLAAVVGDAGRIIFIVLAALAVAVWITGVSLKRVLGVVASWSLLLGRGCAALCATLLRALPRAPHRGARPRPPAIDPPRADAPPIAAEPAGLAALEAPSRPVPPARPLTAPPLEPAIDQMTPDDGRPRVYRLPDLALFDRPDVRIADESNRAHLLEDTLASFGVGAKV
ncbi:MAG: hypothetical protein KGM44_01280, partial [bacterium]|nr:hypothetical protein [bacterium]